MGFRHDSVVVTSSNQLADWDISENLGKASRFYRKSESKSDKFQNESVVTVIGGPCGSGCVADARRGMDVRLYEMRPTIGSAHANQLANLYAQLGKSISQTRLIF
jgi:hypothetical protein